MVKVTPPADPSAPQAVWVEVMATRGSAPRDKGTAMQVTPDTTQGTIGGGALEHQAIAQARKMLASGQYEATETWSLGPALGQCCGGSVTLHFGRSPRAVDIIPPVMHAVLPRSHTPLDLWIWGAGHVGRAVVQAANPADFAITWVDTHRARYPAQPRRDVTVLPAADMPMLAMNAPADTHHLVFTFSHDIDLALCDALLRRPVASIGLIGSATKWRRFRTRLRQFGHTDDNIQRITCPIGDPSRGKRPADIAAGVIAAYSEVHDAARPLPAKRQHQ